MAGNSPHSWIGDSTGKSVLIGPAVQVDCVPVTIASDQPNLNVTVSQSNTLDNNQLYSSAIEVNMAAASTDNPLLLLRNPAGSGKTLYIFKVQAGTSVTNVGVVFKVFSNPTITTNGTAVAVINRNIGGISSSVGLVNSLPTVSSTGGKLSSLSVGQNNNSIIFAEEFSVAVKAGNSLLVTGDPTSNNRQSILSIAWREV